MDKLIERLRECDYCTNTGIAAGAQCPHCVEPREAAHQLELQARENDQLRAALRKHAIKNEQRNVGGLALFNRCEECRSDWRIGTLERHVEGCLVP